MACCSNPLISIIISSVLFLGLTLNLCVSEAKAISPKVPVFRPSPWSFAHATFYGDETVTATFGGACGYGNLLLNGYGTNTVAVSSTLFNNGIGCGSCYQVKCFGSKACNARIQFITVTATNLSPPDWTVSSDDPRWSNPQRVHFDMSMPAFLKIARSEAGIIPIMYRRVPCVRTRGLRFTLQGNGYWLLAFVMNVGGGGNVGRMWVKGSKTGWIRMSHNWGASYQAFATLGGQALSFMLVSYTTKETIVAWNVVPPKWHVGLTYTTNVNFH